MKRLVVIVFAISLATIAFSYLQEDAGMFVNDFPKYVARAYTAIDNEAPIDLQSACKNLPYHDFPSAVKSHPSGQPLYHQHKFRKQCCKWIHRWLCML
jgi:hypothetical protein